jgi:hypothetical protein
MGGRGRAAKKCIDTPISPQECLDAADTILDLCCGGLPLLLGPYMIISAVIATRNTQLFMNGYLRNQLGLTQL